MAKTATTTSQQIALMRSRGIEINDEAKATEILLDIGYYRLGFYFFPFEVNYPNLKGRDHLMKANTKFDDAVALYYFDFDVRNILMQYINRIEVAFRTSIIYKMSNKYSSNPLWFVDNKVVEQGFVDNFDSQCYSTIRKNPVIVRHHKKYKSDTYAPAWKTLEYMTLGNALSLYSSLINYHDRADIASVFGVRQPNVLENYLESVRRVRNICAHGAVLYDVRFFHEVRTGPAGAVGNDEKYRLGAAIKVISFLLGTISKNRQREMILKLNEAFECATRRHKALTAIIETSTQMKWNLSEISCLL